MAKKTSTTKPKPTESTRSGPRTTPAKAPLKRGKQPKTEPSKSTASAPKSTPKPEPKPEVVNVTSTAEPAAQAVFDKLPKDGSHVGIRDIARSLRLLSHDMDGAEVLAPKHRHSISKQLRSLVADGRVVIGGNPPRGQTYARKL